MKAKILTTISIKFKSTEKTSMLISVKGLRYTRYYRLNSIKHAKSPIHFISYNSQKLCSGWRRPKIYWKLEKQQHFSILLEFLNMTRTTCSTEVHGGIASIVFFRYNTTWNILPLFQYGLHFYLIFIFFLLNTANSSTGWLQTKYNIPISSATSRVFRNFNHLDFV